MIGYHYTSLDNWKKIKKEGLLPYKIQRPDLVEYFPPNGEIFGIWLWRERLKEIAHVGSILYQISTKNTSKVVYLKVRYDPDWQLKYYKDDKVYKIELYHYGEFGDFKYHTGKELGRIIIQPIPPEDIKLIARYDLKDAF